MSTIVDHHGNIEQVKETEAKHGTYYKYVMKYVVDIFRTERMRRGREREREGGER